MTFQRGNQSTSRNSQNTENTSMFASRPAVIQTQDLQLASTAEEIEQQNFATTNNFSHQKTSRFNHDFSRILLHSANRPIQRLIQPQLTIGKAGDKYEQEADRVAADVVNRMHQPESEKVQRQEIGEDEELQTKAEIGSIQRQELAEDEDKLQMKPIVQRLGGEGGMAATPDLEASIQQARGSGQPLAENVQKPMEQAFGFDFSRVKVHTNPHSDRLNQSIQAKAFTTGRDIFFRQGAYDPSSRGGQELIAHELTHVVQQQTNKVALSKGKQTSFSVATNSKFLADATNKKNLLNQPQRTIADHQIQATGIETNGDIIQRVKVNVQDRIKLFEAMTQMPANKERSGKTQSLEQGNGQSRDSTQTESFIKYHEQLYTAINQWRSKIETIRALLDYAFASFRYIEKLDRNGGIGWSDNLYMLSDHLELSDVSGFMMMQAIYQSYDELIAETKQKPGIQKPETIVDVEEIDWEGIERSRLMGHRHKSKSKLDSLISSYNQHIAELGQILKYAYQCLGQLRVIKATWGQLQVLYNTRTGWSQRFQEINEGILISDKWTDITVRIVNQGEQWAKERVKQLGNAVLNPAPGKSGIWLDQQMKEIGDFSNPELVTDEIKYDEKYEFYQGYL